MRVSIDGQQISAGADSTISHYSAGLRVYLGVIGSCDERRSSACRVAYGWKMKNILGSAASPYLRQHADNPVAWQEWTDETLAHAREHDIPILLSVGYAACHWCHVMAHESFEDAEVAALLNEHFVPIKVDREERPDVDAAYMAATQAMTGSGGWPMTCLLTPDGTPLWCGTYLTKPQFMQLLTQMVRVWQDQRDEARASGAHVASMLRDAQAGGSHEVISEEDLAEAASMLARSYDAEFGGFGSAPKFPPTMALDFLLRHAIRTGDESALVMVAHTADAIARSGMCDQLAGGFARYAVDRAWVVPHFEKMLYDNALLLRHFAHVAIRADEPLRTLALHSARGTAEFLLRDLRTREGMFASSFDADTDGTEGATYVWTPRELIDVLGEADGARAARALGVTEAGTFEHGTSTLQLLGDIDWDWWLPVRERLLAARSRRPQPDRHGAVIAAWNGLAIAALADAAMALDEPSWLEAAITCADALWETHLVDGELRRTSRDGAVGQAPGVAEDYGDVAEGFVALHLATAEPRWLERARQLLDAASQRFRDADGLIYDVAADTELYVRPRGESDNAEPSGSSALAGALIRYGTVAGSPEYVAAGRESLSLLAGVMREAPRFAGWALCVAEDLASGPLQVAIAAGEGAADLARTARELASPGAMIIVGERDAATLLQGRGPVTGRAAAYVCHGQVCSAPITTRDSLRETLEQRP